VAHSLFLFIFSSTRLQAFVVDYGLPPIPLIPVSSSQAVIGAVLGIAVVHGRGKALRQVRWGVLAKIASGWVSTPLVAALISYLMLFVMQNLFQEEVFQRAAETPSAVTVPAEEQAVEMSPAAEQIEALFGTSDNVASHETQSSKSLGE